MAIRDFPLLAGLAGALACALAAAAAHAAPLRVHSAESVLEAGPLLLAAEASPAGAVQSFNGGVPDLWRGEADLPGRAELAGNAETQGLRLSVTHPDLRMVMTVVEGHYRVVARRSAGIARLPDLRGKRVATFADTSAAYYLHRMLAGAGLTEADVTVLSLPAKAIGDALIGGQADAIAIWEPEAVRAEAALGRDAVVFEDKAGYHEIYNLNTTAAVLADPAKRAEVVAFVRRLVAACRAAERDPAHVQALAAARTGYDPGLVRASWPHHRFPCALPGDLLDVLTQEEAWLAGTERRAPRSRAELAPLIDGSVLREALASP